MTASAASMKIARIRIPPITLLQVIHRTAPTIAAEPGAVWAAPFVGSQRLSLSARSMPQPVLCVANVSDGKSESSLKRLGFPTAVTARPCKENAQFA
jgi:hypothetical protein